VGGSLCARIGMGAGGLQVVNWQRMMDQNWSNLRFGEVKVETKGREHVFEVQVYLNGVDPKAVRVDLYADGIKGGDPVRQEMKRVRQLAVAAGGTIYSAKVSATRPATDYTARVVPSCDGVAIPLEYARIVWQR